MYGTSIENRIYPRAALVKIKGQAAASSLMKSRLRKKYGASLESMLSHFNCDAEVGRLSCKYYDEPHSIGHKKLGHLGQKVSPIILGSLNDLEFYDVVGAPEEIRHMEENLKRSPDREEWCRPGSPRWGRLTPTEQHFCKKILTRGPKIAMPFLKNYLLIPTASGKMVFICDDHHHAVFGWALAGVSGLFKTPPALIHIDEHSDNSGLGYLPSYAESRGLYGLASFMWRDLEIANFIDLASSYDLDGIGKIIDPYEIYFVLSVHNGEGRLESTNNWDSESSLRSGLVDGFDTSIERINEVFLRVKEKGLPVICDIDLDYFFQHFTPHGPEIEYGFSFDQALQQVIDVARRSDFITIATSPNYFLVNNPREVTYLLLSEIINALNYTRIW